MQYVYDHVRYTHSGILMTDHHEDGGWHDDKGPGLPDKVSNGEARIKVVDANHGTMACYWTLFGVCRHTDPNGVPCCWCDK